jgi:FixJ family two-component response regulator
MDVCMPGLRSSDVADRLKDNWAGLAVLFISGHQPEEIAHCGVKTGSAVLRKPFSVLELKSAIAASLFQRNNLSN